MGLAPGTAVHLSSNTQLVPARGPLRDTATYQSERGLEIADRTFIYIIAG